GAAKAVGKVLPEINGKLNGKAVRVPTPDVSIIDSVADVEQPITDQKVNEDYQKAANEDLKDILQYIEEPLVSRDLIGKPHSSIVDSLFTMVLEEQLVNVVSWYDNECAYAARCIGLAAFMNQKGI